MALWLEQSNVSRTCLKSAMFKTRDARTWLKKRLHSECNLQAFEIVQNRRSTPGDSRFKFNSKAEQNLFLLIYFFNSTRFNDISSDLHDLHGIPHCFLFIISKQYSIDSCWRTRKLYVTNKFARVLAPGDKNDRFYSLLYSTVRSTVCASYSKGYSEINIYFFAR